MKATIQKCWLVNLIMLVTVVYASAQSTQLHYDNYYNPRFEYSVSYPANLLYPQEVAANGDGRKFLSRDGRTVMLVYGQENWRNQSFAQFYREESTRGASHPHRVVTYRLFKNDWFVISGTDEGRIFYQKTLLRNGELLTFSIEYDQSQKTTYDAITAAIARSFKWRER